MRNTESDAVNRYTKAARELGIALGGVALALAVSVVLSPYWHEPFPYIPFFLAIIIAIRLTSVVPSLCAIVASVLVVELLVAQSGPNGSVQNPGGLLMAGFFLLSSGTMLVFSERTRKALLGERQTRRQLETAMVRVEESARQVRSQSQRLQMAAEATGLGIFEYDFAQESGSWSAESKAILDISHGQPPGPGLGPLSKGLHPDDRARIEKVLAGWIGGEGPSTLECEYRLLLGAAEVRWVSVRAQLFCGATGEGQRRPLRAAGTVLDVTRRREMEQVLHANEELLRAAFENAPFGFWVRDLEGGLVMQNPSSFREWGKAGPGFGGGGLSGKGTLDFWAGLKGGVVEQEISAGQARKKRYFHTITAPYTVHGQLRGVLGFSMDITERKRAETRANLLAETSSQLLRSERPQEVINLLCEKVMRFLGCEIFLNYLVEGPERLHLNASGGFLPEEVKNLEWLNIKDAVCGAAARKGCRVHLESVQSDPNANTELIRRAGVQAYACHPLGAGDRLLGTLSFGTRTRARFSEEELSLMQAVADLVSIAIERQHNHAELKRINAELEQRVAERTRSLQETADQLNSFCYTVAHDLRAPLRTQQAFSELLLREYAATLGATGIDFARRITEAARRQGELIRDLLAHANLSRSDLPMERVDLAAEFGRIKTDLRLEIEEKGAILHIGELDRFVEANPPSLQVILQNLISNALKFVPKGVVPEVRIWTERRGSYVRICVRDNGIGIDPRHLGRLFGVFQRLAGKEYPGTGIGLALVRKAAERMGGRVGVESEPGKGSLFWTELRLVDAAVAPVSSLLSKAASPEISDCANTCATCETTS